jgi:type IV secretion system protein VirB4
MLTEAARGEFYDLAGPGSQLAFCPLRDIGDDAAAAWAVGWIEVLCELNGLRFGPKTPQCRCRRGNAAPAVAHADAN